MRIAHHSGWLWLLLMLVPATAQTRRIYIANDDHTDYMWSADEATFQAAFLEQLDYYVDLADATSNNPSAYQSRWNCDGSFWVWTYEQHEPAADFARLIRRIRTGHITVPLNPLILNYGGQPAEAVVRGMYYAGSLERRFNLRLPLAIGIENQVMPCGLASLWAGAGAKYTWHGVCACASKVSAPGDREHEIYWWVGPDGSRLLKKWYSLRGNADLGGYAEARNPAVAVDHADAKCFTANYPYAIAGAFGKGWDDLKTLTDEFVTVARAKTTTNRQVIVSNEVDFFQDFEQAYGTNLPAETVTFGNEWDLYVASLAEVSARVKRALEQLRAAEAVVTLVALQDPAFATNRIAARDLAWLSIGLYFDHDWTADGPVARGARAAWQRKVAGQVEGYVTNLHHDAVSALGAMIPKSGANPRFYAFNPLSWVRTDYADLPYSDIAPFRVIDLAVGQETPSQIVTNDGIRYLRVFARDVPAVGYKVFEIQPGAGSNFTAAAGGTGNVISNDFYLLRVASRGAITNLTDKLRGSHEFASNITGRAINDLGSGTGTLQIENAGPVSVTLAAVNASPLNHSSRITLIRDSPRIEIRNDLNQNFSDVHTWGFAFNLPMPDVWHEEVGAVIRAKRQSQGGHYSDRVRNARYDWQTLNHFVDMSSGDIGVTLANADCYFMKLGNSSVGALDTATPLLSPLAGGQVDGAGLGIQNQGGDAHFRQRFALRTHGAYDPAAAMRFTLEFQNPLVTSLVTGRAGSPYPATVFSALTISNPNVLLWALKPAEEGIRHGIIARTWNLSTNAADFSLTFFQPLTRAQRATHIETNRGDLPVSGHTVSATAAPQQLQTFRLNGPPDISVTTGAHTPAGG